MARKTAQPTQLVQDSISVELADDLSQIQNTAGSLVQVAKGDHEIALKAIHQRVGRRQAYAMISKLLTVADLVDLQNIKESKSYKGYVHTDEAGNCQPVSTWDDFCLLVEGRSRQTIDNELLNLNALGPELFESMRTVGIGPGTMRQIRQLPQDKLALLEQVKDSKDKDEVAEIIEALIDRQNKEKTELAAKVEELTDENEAKEKLLIDKNKKIDDQAKKIALIKKLPPDERAQHIRTEISAMQSSIEEELRTNFANGLTSLKEHVGEDHNEFIKAQLQMLDDAVQFLRITFGSTGVEWEES